MELLFVDESGDDGVTEKSSPFYILAGVAVEDIYWKETFWKLSRFRLNILQKYGIRTDELKGEAIFQHEGVLFNSGLFPSDQEWICKSLIDLICHDLKVELFILVKSKNEFHRRYTMPMRNPEKIFRQEVWRGYLSHYEKILVEKSRKTDHLQTGMIFYDKNQEKHVRNLVREFTRRFDPQSEFPAAGLIEDVLFYNSKTSLFIQLADFLASVSLRIARGPSEKDTFKMTEEMINTFRSKMGVFIGE